MLYEKRKTQKKAYVQGRTLVTPDTWQHLKCLSLGEGWCVELAEFAVRKHPRLLKNLDKTVFGLTYPKAARQIMQNAECRMQNARPEA